MTGLHLAVLLVVIFPQGDLYMVTADINSSTGEGIIILRPNNSASWRFNLVIIGSLAAIAVVISLWFLVHGLWLILPFSGLELLCVYAALFACVSNNTTTEVIIFDKNRVTVERGKRFAEDKREYNRAWSKIFIRQPAFRGHMKQIFIRSYGKEQELGAFLNRSDREALIKSLKHVVYS